MYSNPHDNEVYTVQLEERYCGDEEGISDNVWHWDAHNLNDYFFDVPESCIIPFDQFVGKVMFLDREEHVRVIRLELDRKEPEAWVTDGTLMDVVDSSAWNTQDYMEFEEWKRKGDEDDDTHYPVSIYRLTPYPTSGKDEKTDY